MKTQRLILILVGSALIAAAFVGGFFLVKSSPPASVPAVAATQAATEPVETVPAEPLFAVRKAVYGDLPDGPSVDVTEKVAAAFDGTRLSISVSNETMGGDPVFGIPKKLRVEYTLRGKTAYRTAAEGDTLIIRPDEKPVALVILKAVYGDFPGGPTSDVTTKVQEAFDGHSLSIAASNDNFGDPAPGVPKKLRVLYTLDGTEKYKIVEEGETVKLPSDPG